MNAEPFFFAARCPSSLCDVNFGNKSGRSLSNGDLLPEQQQPDDGALMASYSVFVVEPGAELGKRTLHHWLTAKPGKRTYRL